MDRKILYFQSHESKKDNNTEVRMLYHIKMNSVYDNNNDKIRDTPNILIFIHGNYHQVNYHIMAN